MLSSCHPDRAKRAEGPLNGKAYARAGDGSLRPRCHPELVEGSLNGKTCARAGDGGLRASCGLLALRSAQPLACAPLGREKAPPGLSLSALRLLSTALRAGDGSLLPLAPTPCALRRVLWLRGKTMPRKPVHWTGFYRGSDSLPLQSIKIATHKGWLFLWSW